MVAFLVLVYGTITVLAFIPALTGPDLIPGGATLYDSLENILGFAVPAFVVTAMVSGRDGVRDLARRCLRWREPQRWYAISLSACRR